MLGSLAATLSAWDLSVVAPAVRGAREFDRRQPYRVSRVAGLGAGSGTRRFLPCLAGRTLGEALLHRPDVLLCGHPALGPLGQLLRRGLGIPYVVFTYAMELRSRRLRALLPRTFAGAASVLTISEFGTREVLALGAAEGRVQQLPLGFDPQRFSRVECSPLPQELGLEGRPWLLTVSRLHERYKGIDTVLRALPLIAARVPAVRYVVAGQGHLRPYLERLAERLGCRDRVLFVGEVSDADLAALYAQCTAFVLMSRDRIVDGGAEGFGLVFLEANSFGKPVLGGNSGGIPDAVLDGVTGLLADPDSVISVAEQAIRLLTDRELAARLGQQGRERVLRDLTWTAAARRLEQIVREALGEGSDAAAADRVH